MDIKDEKKELRARMAGVRSAIPEHSRSTQSLAACRHLEQKLLSQLRTDRGSLTIFSYLSFGDEPDTGPLVAKCLEMGDRVLVPKITGNGVMTLHSIRGTEDLAPGTWGILEPRPAAPLWPVDWYRAIDLVIVPGLAFDLLGGRIGFGGGYYDRFMAELTGTDQSGSEGTKETHSIIKAAIAFREQLVSTAIPLEDHDFKLDMLFTASGAIYIEGK